MKKTTSSPFNQCATLIMDEMKRPDIFNKFLMEAMYWVHCYYADQPRSEKDKQCDPHWPLKVLAKDVAMPWLILQDKRAIPEMADGLKRVYDMVGAEEFQVGLVLTLSRAFGSAFDDVQLPSKTLNEFVAGLALLAKMEKYFVEYEEQKQKKGKT